MDINIEKVIFEDFSGGSNLHTKEFVKEEIVKLADLKIKVTAQLGTSKATVGEISKYKEGDYIEVDRMAGHTVDIYVGQVKIAIGEILEMENDNFGLKVIKVLDESGEFLKQLNKDGEME